MRGCEMHADYENLNPMRTASWRFDRVLELLEVSPCPVKPLRYREDGYVQCYYQFLRRYLALASEEERKKLSLENQALFGAHLLHADLDAERRAILQAWILTRETDPQIAERIGTLPADIHWYEKLFFNVRDRLNCRAWIVKTIRGASGRQTLHWKTAGGDRQRHVIYRLVAYLGGPLVLDRLIREAANEPPHRESKKDTAGCDEIDIAYMRQHATITASGVEMSDVARPGPV
jgi:hypothetical protein